MDYNLEIQKLLFQYYSMKTVMKTVPFNRFAEMAEEYRSIIKLSYKFRVFFRERTAILNGAEVFLMEIDSVKDRIVITSKQQSMNMTLGLNRYKEDWFLTYD